MGLDCSGYPGESGLINGFVKYLPYQEGCPHGHFTPAISQARLPLVGARKGRPGQCYLSEPEQQLENITEVLRTNRALTAGPLLAAVVAKFLVRATQLVI